ncbi:hypothetical protein [uncultured Pseudacidovorax sp.]|uniref:hypothetical protein n=1 Tax=uncultured Pseudacidovorax sp. TaxID=679313 RepID=UPI0025E1362C|nr:hypothetical protein [uncultured Pseudacidovorax sp.]
MIRAMPWHRAPSEPVRDALPLLLWAPDGELAAATSAAALMLYVALLFQARTETQEDGTTAVIAHATYDELEVATGRPRAMVADGLKRLQRTGLVTPQGSAQRRSYVLTGPHEKWFKLPCRAIVKDGVIQPFTTFSLRSKHELHALKLYLYLAAVRSNAVAYTMAAYETIHARTGIPERDIRRAISLLISSGLLINIDREFSRTLKVNEANKYYLTGNGDLFPRETVPAAAA